jgi:hypothetical protein
MINTNQLTELSENLATAQAAAQTIKSQLSPWLPAIAIAAAWLGRELNRFSDWFTTVASKIIAHGGLVKIFIKFFWNRPQLPDAPSTTHHDQ